jgi:hypothetical protein
VSSKATVVKQPKGHSRIKALRMEKGQYKRNLMSKRGAKMTLKVFISETQRGLPTSTRQGRKCIKLGFGLRHVYLRWYQVQSNDSLEP